jgi:hypothetical protein
MFNDHSLLSLKAVNVSNHTPQPICSFTKRNKALPSLKEIAVIVLKLQRLFFNVKSCNTDAVYQSKIRKHQYQLQKCVIIAYSNNFSTICCTIRHSIKSA